jgi:hypothetical protein
MDKFFYNRIITRNQVIVLNKKKENIPDFREYLKSRVLMLNPEDETRNTIYIDYVTLLYKFCLNKHYSAEKISTLLSIGVYLFNESLEKKLRMSESYQLLTELLNMHDSQREPFYIKMFDNNQKLEILKFFRDTFYKHYTLYEASMTKSVDYTLETASIMNSTLPQIQPLSEGIEIEKEKIPYLRNYEKRPVTEEKTRETEVSKQEIEEKERAKSRENTVQEPEDSKSVNLFKTDEDLKLEAELNLTLKAFYENLDREIKEKDELLIQRLERPASKEKSKKPAAQAPGKTVKK